MSKKLMLLALAAVSAVLFALPAVASAGEWHLEPGNQTFTGSSNPEKPNTVLTASNGDTVTCTSATGTGTSNETGTGGTISLLFHGCKASGTNCTTPGHTTAGTITANGLWTSVFLTNTNTKPGIKIEGENHGQLAEFKCAFGLVTIKVSGSVIGEIEQPCGTKAKKFSMNFESTAHGTQKYMQNTETGTKTDLTVKKEGTGAGTFTGAQDGTGILESANELTLNCT